MKLKYVMLAAAGVSLASAPVYAQDKPKAPESTPSAEAPKLVCKKLAESGSLVRKKRVCRTQEEWDRFSQASRDAMGQGQMSGGTSGN